MKRIFLLLAVMLLAACSNDSDLPTASGKATFRAINAVPTSGEISFLIEERAIGFARYQDVTASTVWDDLSYDFNFDTFFAGRIGLTRIATEFVDAIADRDYTFLISGSLATPTVTLFEDDIRVFEETDTVFAGKFVHASPSMGTLDYYFADPATPPAPGQQVATLSQDEVSTGADFPAGDYVLTLTTAGDHTDVVYQSVTVPFASRNTIFVTLFDGDANDTAPLIVQALPTLGGATVTMPDPGFPPAVEFINVSLDLGASDIYDDEALTSLIVQDHDFRDVESAVDTALGGTTYYYTPTGDTSAVTLEGGFVAAGSTRYRFYATGVAGDFSTDVLIPDRKSLETMVRLTMYHASNNFEFLDLYVVDAGESIDETFAARAGVGPGSQTTDIALQAGSYDIYITEFREKETLAGPYTIDVVLGDIVDMVVVDTVDPAVLDVLFLSGGPAP